MSDKSSNNFESLINSVMNTPGLLDSLKSAAPADRPDILREAGLDVPTFEEFSGELEKISTEIEAISKLWAAASVVAAVAVHIGDEQGDDYSAG
jgi:hypothetical protein